MLMHPLLRSTVLFFSLGVGLTTSNAWAAKNLLTVTEGAYTLPDVSQAVLTLQNVAEFDVRCDVQVVGVIRGRDPATQKELTGRQGSDAVIGFVLKAGRKQERSFDFKRAVDHLRDVWKDPEATLVEVDTLSLVSECSKMESGGVPICSSAASDPDGDGWGWENGQSCKVDGGEGPTEPPVEHDEPGTGGSCSGSQWWSENFHRCFDKQGSCAQYNFSDASTCHTSKDLMACLWEPNRRTCNKKEANRPSEKF